MRRKTVMDLALVAAAGGVLAFELVSLRAALPAAAQALVEQGIVSQVAATSREAGSTVYQLALGAVKESARRFGTVTPPPAAITPKARWAHAAVVLTEGVTHTICIERKREASSASF